MFFDNLKKLCAQKGISAYKACTDVGLNRAAVAKWKKGSQPNGATVIKLADYFGVSVEHLLGSNVDNNSCSSPQQDILNEVDIAFYGDYHELSEDDKEMLRAMARTMLDRQKQKKKRE